MPGGGQRSPPRGGADPAAANQQLLVDSDSGASGSAAARDAPGPSVPQGNSTGLEGVRLVPVGRERWRCLDWSMTGRCSKLPVSELQAGGELWSFDGQDMCQTLVLAHCSSHGIRSKSYRLYRS
jgi:hypothetical protein